MACAYVRLTIRSCTQFDSEPDADDRAGERRGLRRTPAQEPRRALVRMRPAVRTIKLSHAALQVRCL